MLTSISIMIGSDQPKVLAEFYTKVFQKECEMPEEDAWGWLVGNTYVTLGAHSEVHGSAKEPQRLILNFESANVKEDYERIKALGATVVKELYEMEGMPGMWIATFADPDGNYFQLMTPWNKE